MRLGSLPVCVCVCVCAYEHDVSEFAFLLSPLQLPLLLLSHLPHRKANKTKTANIRMPCATSPSRSRVGVTDLLFERLHHLEPVFDGLLEGGLVLGAIQRLTLLPDTHTPAHQ